MWHFIGWMDRGPVHGMSVAMTLEQTVKQLFFKLTITAIITELKVLLKKYCSVVIGGFG